MRDLIIATLVLILTLVIVSYPKPPAEEMNLIYFPPGSSTFVDVSFRNKKRCDFVVQLMRDILRKRMVAEGRKEIETVLDERLMCVPK